MPIPPFGSVPAKSVPVSIQDTEKNILALTPTLGLLAWATDLEQILVADGANWWVLSAYLNKDPQAPDMGWTQGSNRAGYGRDYVTDKLISNSILGNCALGNNSLPTNGAIRYDVTSQTMQIYINGAWQTIVSNFRFEEVQADNYALEHKPLGFTLWIQVYTGNSDSLGLNGLPLIQGYHMSMGAFPVQPIIDGGSF